MRKSVEKSKYVTLKKNRSWMLEKFHGKESYKIDTFNEETRFLFLTEIAEGGKMSTSLFHVQRFSIL